jgi:hypothetical protein
VYISRVLFELSRQRSLPSQRVHSARAIRPNSRLCCVGFVQMFFLLLYNILSSEGVLLLLLIIVDCSEPNRKSNREANIENRTEPLGCVSLHPYKSCMFSTDFGQSVKSYRTADRL